jgi:predicted GIY-YIG superfamily endonuclease
LQILRCRHALFDRNRFNRTFRPQRSSVDFQKSDLARPLLFPACMSGPEKRFVYVIRSDRDPERHYTGLTSNVTRRMALHNAAPSGHTTDHRPWRLVVSIECVDEPTARRFER